MVRPTMARVTIAALLVALVALAVADSAIPVNEASAGSVEVPEQPPKPAGEQFQFQAEVNRLMDIIINSLYSNKEVFLRELISNASDALDKIRFLSLSTPALLNSGSQMEIRVRVDEEASTLEIIDSGVGMTRDDLIKNLGTIAKSGTNSFLKKAQENAQDSSNLIGQFGVGFYSAYLVADRVTVTSKHNDDKQYIWESGAEQTFSISEDVSGESLGRGTKITLHIKDDAKEYLEVDRVRSLIKKYSQFIQFPIFIQTKEEIDVEVKEEDADVKGEDKADDEAKDEDTSNEEPKDEEAADDEDDEIKVEDSDAEEVTPKTKKETRLSWTLVNENKPIWTRDPSEVSEADYHSFFDGISKLPGKPMARAHFKGEGDIEFRSILYIPDKPPVGLYGGNGDFEKDAIRLYVRRVLVSDSFEFGLLPRYLAFLVGIVDSDDLPINVSREMLQQSKTLDVIKRKLVRKALEMIKSLMKQDTEGEKEDDEDEDGKGNTEDKKNESKKSGSRYNKFWTTFGKSIKLGIIEDTANRARLAKLLRFRTSKTNTDDAEDWASLDAYMGRMKEDQDQIYYHSGSDLAGIKESPFLEKLLSKGYEVLYLTEPIDEHMIQQLPDYEGTKFSSVSKDGVKLGDKDQKEEKEKNKAMRKMYKPLTKFLKTALGDKVSKVKLSTLLTDTMCVLSTDQWGYSARMEIIMKAQAFADPDSFSYMTPKAKIMELNPHHPMVKKMLSMIESGDDKEKVAELGHLVYDTALISSGYLMNDNADYAKRMYKWLAQSVGVDPNAPVVEEIPEEEEEEVETVTTTKDQPGTDGEAGDSVTEESEPIGKEGDIDEGVGDEDHDEL